MGFVYYTMKQALAKGLKPNDQQKNHWKGLWYNTSTKQIISGRNRIKNSDGSYIQLNSDGTATKLYDGKNFTKDGKRLLSTQDQNLVRAGQVFNNGKFRKDSSTSDTQYFDAYREALNKRIEEVMPGSTSAQKLEYFVPREVLTESRASGKSDDAFYKDFLNSIIQHNNGGAQSGILGGMLGVNDDHAPEGYYNNLRTVGLVYGAGGKIQYFH